MASSSSVPRSCQMEYEDFISFSRSDDEDNVFDVNVVSDIEDLSSDDGEIRQTDSLGMQLPTATLTAQEQEKIDQCENPKLKRLLVLNRSKNMQLIKLHKKLKDMLMECRRNIYESKKYPQSTRNAAAKVANNAWKLAAPYFKDKKYFAAPFNSDCTRKQHNVELSVYEYTTVPHQWRLFECNRLTSGVICNYNVNRQNYCVKRIVQLKDKLSEGNEVNGEITEEIAHLNNELKQLKGEREKECPPLGSNEHIDWQRISEKFLKDKRSDIECKNIWHNYVHPKINKNEWTEKENQQLTEIVKKYSTQNWERIAQELGNNRTAFISCLHYFNNLWYKFKKSKFTPEEDRLLMAIAEHFKIGGVIPWYKVAHYFEERSRHQLYHRYTYFLSQHDVKKGKFTPAEDILLLVLVDKFGRDFKKCAEYIPHRSQIQLKSRYNSNLQQCIKKGSFTVDDDQAILAHVEQNGEAAWGGLTRSLGRCRGQIRQRYLTIKAFMEANPHAELSQVPKRKHAGSLNGNDEYYFLREMADTYKGSSIPTIAMIEESLQSVEKAKQLSLIKIDRNVHKQTKEKVDSTDALLVNIFCNHLKIKQQRCVNAQGFKEAAANVTEVLSQLGAQLDIHPDFMQDPRLDDYDKEILSFLQFSSNQNSAGINKLVAPDICTLAGLRSLLLKHKHYKTQHSDNHNHDIAWSMQQYLQSLSVDERDKVTAARNLYSKRFSALFKWSSILSLEKPNYEDPESISTSSPSITDLTKTIHTSVPCKKILKKPRINAAPAQNVESSSNKRPAPESDSNSVMKKPKLKTYSRSNKVNKTINIIKVQSVNIRKSSGTVSSTIRSSKPAMETEQTNTSAQVKKESQNNEYEAIKDDEQLLSEILHYEGLKPELL